MRRRHDAADVLGRRMQKHPMWGVDTSRWSWLRHALAWAIFIPAMLVIGWLAQMITAAVLPF